MTWRQRFMSRYYVWEFRVRGWCRQGWCRLRWHRRQRKLGINGNNVYLYQVCPRCHLRSQVVIIVQSR